MILEATIAIMLIGGVLLVMYAKSTEKADISEYVYQLQDEILLDISINETLRDEVLGAEHDDNITLEPFVNPKIPDAFKFEIRICDLGEVCKMDTYISKDIFVKEIIISSNLGEYDPKKVRLFVWAG